MPTLTVRNVPVRIVKALKSLASRHHRSMEQEVRALLEEHVEPLADRRAVLKAIEESWSRQTRPTTAEEIEEWIRTGRE